MANILQDKNGIVGGVCLIIAAVIGILWFILRTEEVPFILRNAETQERITGRIYIDGKKNAIIVDPDTLQIAVPLRRGQHKILAESYGYYPKTEILEWHEKPFNIFLDQWSSDLFPLSLVGWQSWNNDMTVSMGTSVNECIVNSAAVVTGGFYNGTVTTTLRGRTLVLFFANTDESVYDDDRMVKVTYNNGDLLLMPADPTSLLYGEYLPKGDTPTSRGIEFLIPEDFDGKLNFVFYQAKLNNLKITVFYR
ncbi:MAG: hypothetical protein LBQ89_07810 [Treponema sp.]|jgi:hypothetical protein|nr:hypothetical protein [Treponema sp.]